MMLTTLADAVASGQPDSIISLALPTMALVFCVEKGGQAVQWIVRLAQGHGQKPDRDGGVSALASAVRSLSTRLDDQHAAMLDNNRLLAETMREQTRTMNQLLFALQNVCRKDQPTRETLCEHD